MYRYKKIMVALNLDEHDSRLIQYAGFISRMARSDEVYFIHVTDTFDIPDEIKKIYPQLATPVDKAVEERMKAAADNSFNGYDKTKIRFKALEGPALGVLISSTKKYDADLLIVGLRTNETTSTYSLSEKLARKAFCSILMIPNNARVYLEKILVTVDFSQHSVNALDVGSAFAKAAAIDNIHILNIFRIPSDYEKTGKSYDDFSDIMLENAKTKLKTLLPQTDLKSIGITPYFRQSNDIVNGICQFSESLDADLVVVGARGRSGDIAAILLGSITEGLIRKLHRPLLAVKNKGEGLNIFEALSSE